MLHGLELGYLCIQLLYVTLVLLQTGHNHLLLVADILVKLTQLWTPLGNEKIISYLCMNSKVLLESWNKEEIYLRNNYHFILLIVIGQFTKLGKIWKGS